MLTKPTSNHYPHLFPSDDEILLLNAIFHPNQRAHYLEQWKQTNSAIQYRHQQLFLHLLPDIQSYLDTTLTQQIKNLSQSVKFKNQFLFLYAKKLIEILHAEKIDILVLKGAVMVTDYYHDHAVRPMADFDIMMSRDQLPKVESILREHDWTPDQAMQPWQYPYKHSLGWTKHRHFSIDIHWHLFEEACFYQGFTEQFWQHATSTTIENLNVLRLSPTDMLFHLIVHGYGPDKTQDIRWIIDILTILQKDQNNIDWDHFIAMSERIHLISIVSAVIHFIHESQLISLPESVIKKLNKTPLSKLEKWEYQYKSKPVAQQWLRATHHDIIQYYLREKPSRTLLSSQSFWRYYLNKRNLTHPAKLPGYFVKRLKLRFTGSGKQAA